MVKIDEQRFDAHMHGPIGFQPYWLRKQGYSGKNVLALMIDTAVKRGITISAVTSQESEISPGSVHDRLDYLKRQIPTLPVGYRAEPLGREVIVGENNKGKVYFVNGQTVMIQEGGQKFDMLVVGSNRVPNFRTFRDTLAYGKDHGLIQIAEHPFVIGHQGMGPRRLEEHAEEFDAFEGLNGQLIFPRWIKHVPAIGGRLAKYSKEMNDLAIAAAERHRKPWIATSDAHRIEDLGIGYIFWNGLIDESSDANLIRQLRSRVRGGHFKKHQSYEPVSGWFSWTRTFTNGLAESLKTSKV